MQAIPLTSAEPHIIQQRIRTSRAIVLRNTNQGPLIEEYRDGKLLKGSELDVPPSRQLRQDGYQVGSIMMLSRLTKLQYASVFPQDTYNEIVPWIEVLARVVRNEDGDPLIYDIPVGWRVKYIRPNNGNGFITLEAIRFEGSKFEDSKMIPIKGSNSTKVLSESDLWVMFNQIGVSMWNINTSVRHSFIEGAFNLAELYNPGNPLVIAWKIGFKVVVLLIKKYGPEISIKMISEVNKIILKDKDSFERSRKNGTLTNYLLKVTSEAASVVIEDLIVGRLVKSLKGDFKTTNQIRKYITEKTHEVFMSQLLKLLIKDLIKVSSILDNSFKKVLPANPVDKTPKQTDKIDLVGKGYDLRDKYITEFTQKLFKDFEKILVNEL